MSIIATRKSKCQRFFGFLYIVYFLTMFNYSVSAVEAPPESVQALRTSGYSEMPVINNISPDKVFKVTFSQDINFNTINTSTIELLDNDGARVDIEYQKATARQINITPQSRLTNGERYYLLIHPGVIKSLDGTDTLETGVVTEINILPAPAVNSIEITGADMINIPAEGEVNEAYSAVVKDQKLNLMATETVSWTLPIPVNGVAVNAASGVVTINHMASGGSFTLVVKSNSNTAVTQTKLVSLIPQPGTSLEPIDILLNLWLPCFDGKFSGRTSYSGLKVELWDTTLNQKLGETAINDDGTGYGTFTLLNFPTELVFTWGYRVIDADGHEIIGLTEITPTV